MSNLIKCPHCSHEFEMTESITSEIRIHLEKELKIETEKKDLQIKELLLQAEKASELAAKDFEVKLQEEKKNLWKLAQEKAAEKQGIELKDLQEQLKEKEESLLKAQEQELEMRKKQRELEKKEKDLELEMQRKLDKELEKVSEEAKKLANEESRMKILEKDKQMEMMRAQIEELKRKSEQGSMQIQGEVQEEDLKNILQTNFSFDLITDVPTGINGADLVHTVINPFGQKSGVILWESKNTKSFSHGWVKKLKDDQGAIKADLSVIVTQVLPEGIDSFGFYEGVWVTSYKFVLPLTMALRHNLIQIAQTKAANEGKDEKMDVLFKYLSGPQFKNRVENIVTAFTSMKEELDKEKRAMQRIWSRREVEIDRVIMNTSGLYGDMQGIVGSSIGKIESLELDFEEEEELPADGDIDDVGDMSLGL
jgi:hypothetical protein